MNDNLFTSDVPRFAVSLKEKKCTEAFQKRVQRLKEENVTRSRKLKKQYPLPPLFSSE